MNINIRSYVIDNFKNDDIDDIRKSIDKSIKSEEDEPLIGLGVLFELLWKNSDERTKSQILTNIKKGI